MKEKHICVIIHYRMPEDFFNFLQRPSVNYFENSCADAENSLDEFETRFYYERKYKGDFKKLSKKEQSKIYSEYFQYYQDKKTDKIYKKQITSAELYQPLEPPPDW